MKDLKLDVNKDIQIQLFGIGTTIADKCDYVSTTYGSKYKTGKSFTEEGKPIVGYGIKTELSFKNIRVSDKLAEIILNMIGNVQPTKQNLESLKTSERQLFDLLIHVSGLSKKIILKQTIIFHELKERLKLVEGKIRAGNDDHIVIKELVDNVKKVTII